MRFDVPKLADYSGAIQANQSMANAFSNLGNQSQDYLKMEEQKKNNEWNKAFDTQKFDETKKQNEIANINTDRTFNYGVTRDGVKDNQWQQGYDLNKDSVVFDQNYKNKTFDHNVSQDNIKNSQWQQAFNKPDYATFNGVDTQGNPTLSMINKNNGNVVNTGAVVYREPKEMSPYQAENIQLRKDMQNSKIVETNKKAVDDLSALDNWSGLTPELQLKAIEYYNKTGIKPQIKGFDMIGGGEKRLELPAEYGGTIPLNNKKDGSNINLYKD